MQTCTNICVLGKSVLASSIIRMLEDHTGGTVLYYFCSSFSLHGNELNHILKCLTTQLVRRNQGLCAYIHKEYIEKGWSSSTSKLKSLISYLLNGLEETRICVDGVDECAETDQSQVILGLLPLARPQESGGRCKILFTSRDIRSISRHLAKYPTMALSAERSFIEPAIRNFVHESLPDFPDQVAYEGHQDMVNRIEQDIVAKAEGLNIPTMLYRLH